MNRNSQVIGQNIQLQHCLHRLGQEDLTLAKKIDRIIGDRYYYKQYKSRISCHQQESNNRNSIGSQRHLQLPKIQNGPKNQFLNQIRLKIFTSLPYCMEKRESSAKFLHPIVHHNDKNNQQEHKMIDQIIPYYNDRRNMMTSANNGPESTVKDNINDPFQIDPQRTPQDIVQARIYSSKDNISSQIIDNQRVYSSIEGKIINQNAENSDMIAHSKNNNRKSNASLSNGDPDKISFNLSKLCIASSHDSQNKIVYTSNILRKQVKKPSHSILTIEQILDDSVKETELLTKRGRERELATRSGENSVFSSDHFLEKSKIPHLSQSNSGRQEKQQPDSYPKQKTIKIEQEGHNYSMQVLPSQESQKRSISSSFDNLIDTSHSENLTSSFENKPKHCNDFPQTSIFTKGFYKLSSINKNEYIFPLNLPRKKVSSKLLASKELPKTSIKLSQIMQNKFIVDSLSSYQQKSPQSSP